MNLAIYNRFRKQLSVIILLIMAMTCFAGCKKQSSEDHELHKFISQRKLDEITEEDLGDIITEGDYYGVNPDNMLSYMGAYKGLDYVTLVFESDSPISLENIELCISENTVFNTNFEGILYQRKDDKKFVMFKFETQIFEYPDGRIEQYNTAKIEKSFNFPTKAGEPMSYYFIRISPYIADDYYAAVSENIQKEIVDQSYWTDYKYDSRNQYYDKETDSWTEEFLQDCMTNNMPLE